MCYYAGVVHGDLKPANIMLKASSEDRRGFTVKVCGAGGTGRGGAGQGGAGRTQLLHLQIANRRPEPHTHVTVHVRSRAAPRASRLLTLS